MMISRPAPEEPPMMETIRLGVIAMHRVTRFLNHFFILMSKNPYLSYHRSNRSRGYTNILCKKKKNILSPEHIYIYIYIVVEWKMLLS